MIRIIFFCVLCFVTLPAHADDTPFLPVKEITSPDGWTAWLVEDHSQPITAVAFGFQGAGAVTDPGDKQGLARILSNTLDEGAGPYDSKAFQGELDNNTISLSFTAGRDHFYGSMKTLTDTRDHAFDLLRLAVTEPRFDDDAIARMVNDNLTRIRNSKNDPEWLAARLMNDRAFTPPYNQNSGGTLTSLTKITADDLRAARHDHLRLSNLRIAVVGDITEKELVDKINTTFGGLLHETWQMKETMPVPIQNVGKIFIHKLDIPQTVVMMAGDAPGRDAPDYAAYVVTNYVLGGGGFGSRLMTSVREKAGLSYGIYSGIDHMLPTSYLTISGSTKNETANQMRDMTNAEITRLASGGITQDELDAAKGYLLGSMANALTSTDKIAGVMLGQLMDNRAPNDLDVYRAAIAAVTLDDVKQTAQKWLNPGQMVDIMVGNPGPVPGAVMVESIPNIQ